MHNPKANALWPHHKHAPPHLYIPVLPYCLNMSEIWLGVTVLHVNVRYNGFV